MSFLKKHTCQTAQLLTIIEAMQARFKLCKDGSMDFNTYDSIASELESSGMWRRAAARWLIVMQMSKLTDTQREQIRKRRNHCIFISKDTCAQNGIDIHLIIRAGNHKTLINDTDTSN